MRDRDRSGIPEAKWRDKADSPPVRPKIGIITPAIYLKLANLARAWALFYQRRVTMAAIDRLVARIANF